MKIVRSCHIVVSLFTFSLFVIDQYFLLVWHVAGGNDGLYDKDHIDK